MRGNFLKAGLLSAAALFSSSAAPAEPMAETLRFAVMREGQQIGTNTIELRRNGSETTVQMMTQVQVKIAFVTVYRFEQTETERWVGGKLMALSAVTNDNGTRHRVKATRTNDRLTIEADGKTTEVAGNTIPASLWNPLLLEKTVAFNPQDGTMMPIAVTDRGVDQLVVQGRAKRTRHYVINSTFPQDVWYDDARQLVKVELKVSDGSTIRYQPG
ncbi:MAG TPA: DUF6134 family protein [Xanthobacteraceae bacterium]|nr:DUF6134 family protein [Xanthobacteraceae bacterium]